MQMRNVFPKWFQATANKSHEAWYADVSFPAFIPHAIDVIHRDIETQWSDADRLSQFCSEVILDVVNLETSINPFKIASGWFMRFFISGEMMVCANMNGRFGLSYDWLCCSIREKHPLEHQEPPHTILIERPLNIFGLEKSVIPIISKLSLGVISTWLEQCFYYGRMHGGHRDLIGSVYEESEQFVKKHFITAKGEDLYTIVSAASQLAAWAMLNDKDPSEIVKMLQVLYQHNGISSKLKRVIGVTLGTSLGSLTKQGVGYWARNALRKIKPFLSPHDSLQLTVNAVVLDYDKSSHLAKHVHKLVISQALSALKACNNNRIFFNFQQIRLFNIISPYLVVLAKNGDSATILDLICSWYLISDNTRKRSPSVVLITNTELGELLACNENVKVIDNTGISYTNTVIDATNRFLTMHIAVHDDWNQEEISLEGNPAQDMQAGNTFNAVLTDYYAFNLATQFLQPLTEAPSTSLIPLSTLPHPIQPLMLRDCGFTFPITSSYEAPQNDRTIQKVLLLHMANYTGPAELEAASSFMQSKGIEVESHTWADLSIDQIMAFYHNELYDLVWISTHGEFVANDPHLSQFHISPENDVITLAEFMPRVFESSGRRLLFFNFCFGGAAQIVPAPPRYGFAPILASRNQAVISHLWPTNFVAAPAFGSLIAIGLAESTSYFSAFCFAVEKMIGGRETIISTLRAHSPFFDPIINLIDRNSVDVDNISSWGSPVFYE